MFPAVIGNKSAVIEYKWWNVIKNGKTLYANMHVFVQTTEFSSQTSWLRAGTALSHRSLYKYCTTHASTNTALLQVLFLEESRFTFFERRNSRPELFFCLCT